MTRALLALDGFDSKKHSSIIGYFNKNYIATGKIDVNYNKMLSNAFQIRNQSDYNDFYLVSHEDAQKQLEHASVFTEFIGRYMQVFAKRPPKSRIEANR